MDMDKLDAIKSKIEILKLHSEKMSKHYKIVLEHIISDLKDNSLLEEAIDDLSREIDDYFKDSGYHRGFF